MVSKIVIPDPGANMSVILFLLEKDAIVSSLFVAATLVTFLMQAGRSMPAVLPSLPVAAKTEMFFAMALFMACVSAESSLSQ